jgi:hypothetical protein
MAMSMGCFLHLQIVKMLLRLHRNHLTEERRRNRHHARLLRQ